MTLHDFILINSMLIVQATTGFSIAIKGAVQILSAFIHPGKPITVMYATMFGNSTAFQTLYLLQGIIFPSSYVLF